MPDVTAFDENAALKQGQAFAALMKRVGTHGEFPVAAGSSRSRDEKASSPYQGSPGVLFCLMTGPTRTPGASATLGPLTAPCPAQGMSKVPDVSMRWMSGLSARSGTGGSP